MYPSIQFSSNEDGTPNKFHKILESHQWKNDPKLMGKVYRFLSSQEAWRCGTTMTAKMGQHLLKETYAQLQQFH